ncbi:phosphoserine phosphatase SerB [Jiella avicenniae]|uniref:Phosphoserine phosphatase n=1 Tax=Jiella avicenniae TaxID=2907202 RepID=A0A9X1NWZ2_9HYPH|nr:phosphoserine phosphatase SerB [Jiella avicenniae]MCE7027047.1 phosphoserine phosphatase SerB [Jiella avicenniae]
MHVATLIANPDGAPFTAQAIAAVASRLGASPDAVDWLADGFAADLALAAPPVADARAAAANEAAGLGIDLVVQEAAGRRKRFLIADMDSTMIEQECIDELAAEVGIKDRIAAITARAMNGEIAFEPALRERVGLLAGLPESVVEKVIAERITHARGGKRLIATMRANGAHTALVSGGFTVFTGPIGAALGFHETRANRLIAEGGKLTGEVGEPILGAEAKVAALREIAAERGLAPADTIAVGDGANDLPMLQLAGTGVALHAKPKVAASAPHRIDHGDLTALLYIQGYRQSEFVDG